MPSPVADTPAVPSWMDARFLARGVRGAGLDGVIVSTDIETIGGKGDSYASTMLRVLAHLDNGKDLSMMVKGSTGGFDIDAAFPVEGLLYSKILPRMAALLKMAGRNQDQIGPKLYLYETDPEPILVMEDLVASGFTMSNRLRGLSLDEMLVAVRKMAVFHAASKVLHDHEPSLFDAPFMPMLGHKNYILAEKFFKMGLVRFISEVESWNDDLSRSVVPKLKAIAENDFEERIINVANDVKNERGVLIHGDLWTNNMLFLRESSGKVQDVRFVDFQLSGWCSRATELHYFFTTSPDAEVRKDRGRRQLLAAYHQELVECLRDLGHPESRIPSLQNIEAEFEHSAILGLAIFVCSFALVIAPGHLDLNFMNGILDEYDGPPPHPRARALAQPAYRALAREALQGWEEDGLLDRLVREGEEER